MAITSHACGWLTIRAGTTLVVTGGGADVVGPACQADVPAFRDVGTLGPALLVTLDDPPSRRVCGSFVFPLESQPEGTFWSSAATPEAG